MLEGLLSFLFALMCIFLVLIILVQKGKSSLGIGSLGGSNQMIFGGGGGQNVFQKITWIMGGVLILGSLGMATMKYRSRNASIIKHSVPAKAK
jgi:preprotein translocase subunit SecG